ncbi:MAG TPA: efflux RND transporter permease subunit [Candidatus Limnocylindrales bacterium]|nr:efflux RND transporter permease subunit [Candidatus Limnocylindrales bacterium]
MKRGLAGRIAQAFINSRLTPLLIVASLMLGAFAILKTPREEDPQIVVPMLDIFVSMPGASAQEVEQRVSIPMEKLLAEIPDAKYVYSTSMPGSALVTVRYDVGVNENDAVVRTYNKLYSNFDHIPPGASRPLIKVRSIYHVPILALTFWSHGDNAYQLRQIVEEVNLAVKQVNNVSETTIIGGDRRQLRVVLNPQRLAAYHLSPGSIARAFQVSNQRTIAGSFAEKNQEIVVEAGSFVSSIQDVRQLVVGVFSGQPVYLGDVADVQDGAEEPQNYVYFGLGAAAKNASSDESPAVTLAVAKRPGTNATDVAQNVIAKVDSLRGIVIPDNVRITVTRDYGKTAEQKSNDLLKHLLLATLSVTLLVALVLGWRESGVVLVAVPVTLALTLFIFYFHGYTLNRVTLFALIFSIGILVDDAIVVVENVVRHFRLPENQGRPLSEVAIEAVDEVGNPTILATFAVIAAILPMAFVRGLMGPYMRPIPVGASAAMLFSLAIAFIVSPWAALHLLGRHAAAAAPADESQGWTRRLFRRIITPLVASTRHRWIFLGGVAALLLAACLLVPLKLVLVKMLPFDNKSEFQVVVDMPAGTPLERTLAVEQEIGRYLHTQPLVENYQIYAGTSSPYNFNGLVRHYYLRRAPYQGDIQVNLLPISKRSEQSHPIALEMRGPIDEIAQRWNARVKIAEVPPGPPVLATLVAEVYGPSYPQQIALARQIRQLFQQTPGVVDVDWLVNANQKKLDFKVEQDKAALLGISAADASESLAIALGGDNVGLMHLPDSREDVPIHIQLARASRSNEDALRGVYLNSPNGQMVPLGAVVRVDHSLVDKDIYRKNLRSVVYVTGDVAGGEESPVYAILKLKQKIAALKLPEGYGVTQYYTGPPPSTNKLAVTWDGEWHITYEVFRDLGLAFAAVLLLIYVLVVGWFESYTTPLVIMAPIPLTLIGILPAHALAGAFFTATSMIGFIAGAGIIVRNSIILVDFIQLRLAEGIPLEEAVVDAGAVRFRPVMLTALAVVVGASPILFDPIFQGLAISLMAGGLVSAMLSFLTVPLLYYMIERRHKMPLSTSS